MLTDLWSPAEAGRGSALRNTQPQPGPDGVTAAASQVLSPAVKLYPRDASVLWLSMLLDCLSELWRLEGACEQQEERQCWQV